MAWSIKIWFGGQAAVADELGVRTCYDPHIVWQNKKKKNKTKKTPLTNKYLIMKMCPKIFSKKRWNGTWYTNSFSQQHASALPKSNVFYPKNFNGIQIVKCVFTPSHDKKHYFQFPLLSSKCNRMRQPCEWVTPRVSHLAVKSHLLARSLLHSSLGSQPFSTLYPYLS